MDTSVRDNSTHHCCAVSWSAIIAGALVAFSLSVLFRLLNTGLGLVTFPESFHAPASLSILAYVWLIICAIVAMFCAGYVAGKIFRHHSSSSCGGFIHGFLAWSLALLLSIMIAAHFAQAGAHVLAANVAESTNVEANATQNDATSEQRTEHAATVLGGVTLGIFFLFLIGAASASLGGYVGAKRDDTQTKP